MKISCKNRACPKANTFVKVPDESVCCPFCRTTYQSVNEIKKWQATCYEVYQKRNNYALHSVTVATILLLIFLVFTIAFRLGVDTFLGIFVIEFVVTLLAYTLCYSRAKNIFPIPSHPQS